MTRVQHQQWGLEEHMQSSPVYKSLTSSLFICLSFSALVLAGLILRCALQQLRCAASPPNPMFNSAHAVPTSTEELLHSPAVDPYAMDPVFDDPLAGVYFPITSAQIVALADKRAADAAREEGQTDIPSAASLIDDAEAEILQERMVAYIRQFEEKHNGETWPRSMVSMTELK